MVDRGKGPRLNSNDGINFVKDMVMKISRVTTTQKFPRKTYDVLYEFTFFKIFLHCACFYTRKHSDEMNSNDTVQ